MNRTILGVTFLCLLWGFSNLFAGSETSEAFVEAAWKAWEANDQQQVEQNFRAALQADPSNSRAHLGLSFLYSYQTKYEESWAAFQNLLQTEKDFHPYLYAAWFMAKYRLNYHNPKTGVVKLWETLSESADAGGILKAMANEQLGEYYRERGDLAKSDRFFLQMNAIKDWMLAGPFENISASGFDKVYPPELEYDATKAYVGKNGIPVKWFKIAAVRPDYWIDYRRYFAHYQSIFYANNFVCSPHKQTVQLRIGTSGSLKTFLNDELVIEYFDENNNDLDTYVVETELQEGWNRLLIKCGFSEIESCNFMARITDAHGEAIPELKISTEPQKYVRQPGAARKVIDNFAESFFKQKIQAHPSHLENYLLLADCYLRNDKAIEAELALRDAIKLSPNCAMLHGRIVEAYLRGEKQDEVATTYEKIFALDLNSPEMLRHKISQYLENQEFDKAEELLKRIETLLPQSEATYELQIQFYAKKELIDRMLATLDQAHEQHPHTWGFAYAKALFSSQATKNFDQAIALLEDYLKVNYAEVALKTLADTYLQASNLEKWKKTMQKVFELQPAGPGYYHLSSGVYLLQQDYANAEQAIKQALAICPNSSTYWSQLGAIHRSQKQLELAKQDYREALSYNPTDYEAREKLRELEGKKSIFSNFETSDLQQLMKESPSAESYPNDGGIILLHDARRVVYEQGASESMEEVLVKVFNNNGIDDFKEYWISYNAYTEVLNVEKAVVIKADGSEINADIQDDHVVFKSLEENDFLYLRWRLKKYYSGKLAHHFWDTFYFNGFYPYGKIQYSLLVPESFKFRHNAQNLTAQMIKKHTEEGVLYQWTSVNEPAVEYEYSMPSLDDVGRILHVSSIDDWEYLVDWYADLARTKPRLSYELKEEVDKLFAGRENLSEKEKLTTIYNFITEKIRYSSVSFRQSGLVPQSARDVLVNKIGDCKDMTTLCIAMLDAVGMKAHYLLVNTKDEGQNKNTLPSLSFNHCIAAVETQSGLQYVDLTAYNYPLGSVPEPDIEGFSLLIKPGVKAPGYLPRLEFSPGNIFRQTTMKVHDDNHIAVQTKATKTSAMGARMRMAYRNKGQREREKTMTETLSHDLPNVKLTGFEIENLDELQPAVHYGYQYEVSDYLSEVGQFKLLRVNWADALTADQGLSYEKRSFAYQTWTVADTLIEEIAIELPAGYQPVDMAPNVNLTSPFADYSVSYVSSPGRITGKRVLSSKKINIDPEEYVDFKQFYNSVVKEDARQILLKPK